MPLRPTFCGLSLMDFKASMGWGSEQTSEIRVSLVQDVENGDVPSPPPIGTPIYFQFFSFKFFGLLQKWSKRNSQSGFPVWEAVGHDPRDILRGTQVILSRYNGASSGVANLINAYGWWENNFGFGSSMSNDSGMPWNLLRTAVLNIVNSPVYGLYGGPLSYRGFSYSLDLSELPVPDINYRIGGGSVGLLDVIARVCDDGACDFFVELVGFTIKVRTISRLKQPPLGTIAAITNTNWGNVIRSDDGLEARNEITSAFLTGGDVCQLFQADSSGMASFWGYDLDGNPILGVPGVFNFFGPAPNDPLLGPAPLIGSIPTEYMTLNAKGVEDIIGSTTYLCSTLEMRLALINYESWSAFIWHHRPQMKPILYSPFRNQGGLDMQVRPNIVNDDVVAAQQVGMAGINSDFHVRIMKLYNFVKGYATDYYGKKFLVGLPFVLSKQDADTLKVTYTQEPTDGGWLPEDSPPLGLSPLNQDIFKNGDGRFRAFVGFTGLAGVDIAKVSPGDSVVENGALYLRATVEPGMVFLPDTNQPAALVTLGSAVYDEAVAANGDNAIMAAVLSMPPAQAQPWLNRQFGPVGLRINPKARYPAAFAVPLRSNVLTYGPWYVAGPPGKTRYDQDATMTPWNYGGWNEMNLAGHARVINAVSNMQVSEAGTLEVAGPPTANLGEVLLSGGPNITNVDVSYGRDGVTTSYRFQTFTPRFGVFSKQLADRIKQLGLTSQELRKAIRAGINQQIDVADTVNKAFVGFIANAPRAVNPNTPHEVMVSHSVSEVDQQGKTNIRVCPMSMTYEEAVALVRGDDDSEYVTKACMSLDGLVRPFTTKIGAGESALMPAFVEPTSALGLNVTKMNPFPAGNDIAYLASGSTYNRLHAYETGNNVDNTRAMALRGPLVVAGWGWDTDGKPTPGDGDGGWLANVLRRSDQWKAGPVDLLWDERRGVWTSHDLQRGFLQGVAPAGGSGIVSVYGYQDWNLQVFNPWSASVSGMMVMAGYIAAFNRYELIAADCGV